MQYFEISYYRNYHWIDKKYVSSEIGSGGAISKSKLKNIVDVQEITEEEYIAGKQRRREAEQKRKDHKKELEFIL